MDRERIYGKKEIEEYCNADELLKIEDYYFGLCDKAKTVIDGMEDVANCDENEKYILRLVTEAHIAMDDVIKTGKGNDIPYFRQVYDLVNKTNHFAQDRHINSFLIVLMTLWKFVCDEEVKIPTHIMVACIGAFKALGYMDEVVKTGEYEQYEYAKE